MQKKILFLGETYRADAITWINGLKEFGNFEIVTWELKTKGDGISQLKRIFEFCIAVFEIKKIAKAQEVNMIIAERTTSYGFLAALSGVKPIAIAQQGSTDIWPANSPFNFFKKILQNFAFKKATLIHAWGPVMAEDMIAEKVDMSKVLILPKGINLSQFEFKNTLQNSKIEAIVTRSLQPEYKHDVILKAFSILKSQQVPFHLTIVGGGFLLENLIELTKKLDLENEVTFTGKIDNTVLPNLLQKSNIYISMPTTEGVSASLFEGMASGCFPIVTNLPGNKSWIKHEINGVLVPTEDEKALAKSIVWAFKNNEIREKAIVNNRTFVEQNANYATNMKIISDKYHELINLHIQ